MRDVKLTKHGEQRIRDRLGINKNSASKNAQKAFDIGITQSETHGSLRRYFEYLNLKSKNVDNVRIYCKCVYLFSGKILITVMQLPQEHRKAVDLIMEKRKKDKLDSKGEKNK